MTTEKLVIDTLRALELTPAGQIVVSHDDPPTVFVTMQIRRDGSGKQAPPNAALHAAAAQLRNQGLHVEFLLRHGESEEIELGLRATILHSHIDYIRNVFLSLRSGRARVWVEPKQALEEATLRELEQRAQTFLNLFEVQLDEIVLTSEELLPSKLALLATIRHFAPATLTVIASQLVQRGFTVPSPDWLLRRLDALRKGADVVRLGTGEYTLTRHSLHGLGTSKNAKSPDIGRLLALARRGE